MCVINNVCQNNRIQNFSKAISRRGMKTIISYDSYNIEYGYFVLTRTFLVHNNIQQNIEYQWSWLNQKQSHNQQERNSGPLSREFRWTSIDKKTASN